jgi:hypothetical protein
MGWIMTYRIVVGVLGLAGLLLAPIASSAQLGGMQMPGGMSLPTGGFSKDSLLQQAKSILSDLTSMKSDPKLGTEQKKQVDDMLPKAQSINDELEKPKVDAGRLPQLAQNLSDLQKQLGVLKGFLK